MLTLYTDGASRGNPGPGAAAFLAVLGEKIVKEYAEFLGKVTNNIAEYNAVIRALDYAMKRREKEVTLISDSELVVRQLQGIYRIRAKHLFPYYDKVKVLERKFGKVVYQHAPRENPYISKCDRLVNEVLDRN